MFKSLVTVLSLCIFLTISYVQVFAALLGDVNADGKIDALDFSALVSCYGTKAASQSCTNKEGADLNLDGVIDGIDYNIFLRAFITYTQTQATITPTVSVTGTSGSLSPTVSPSSTNIPTQTQPVQKIPSSPTPSTGPLVSTIECSSSSNKKCSFTSSCSSNGGTCGCKVPNLNQDRIYKCIAGEWQYQLNSNTMSCLQNCNE